MPLDEIQSVLAASFGLGERLIVGLKDEAQDIHFPLTLLSRAPSYFSNRPPYVLLLDPLDDPASGIPEPVAAGVPAPPDQTSQSGLNDAQISELINTARSVATNGVLDRPQFHAIFRHVVGEAATQDAAQQIDQSLNRLFDIFDRDKNGVVDAAELLTGLSVLASGHGDNKVRETFALYDIDGDGYISLAEMTRYLVSVFSVIAETSPDFARHGVRPEELADATARRCFAVADINNDGRLSFEEFQSWYASNGEEPGTPAHDYAYDAGPSEVEAEEAEMELPSLEAVRKATGLGSINPTEAFETFKYFAPNGLVSRATFQQCIQRFMPTMTEVGEHGHRYFAKIVDRLFDLFDTDHNGVVDLTELASGLSVLCGGSRDDKVRAAFDLCKLARVDQHRQLLAFTLALSPAPPCRCVADDLNGDGFISLDEMANYLTSVFKVLYQTSPETRDSIDVGPEELAAITAQQCFEDADVNHDGRLSYDEFKRWYSLPSGGGGVADAAASAAAAHQHQTSATQSSSSHVYSADEICEITQLKQYTLADIVQVFTAASEPDGVLDHQSFLDCFATLAEAQLMTLAQQTHLQAVVQHLFETFDADGNGVIDLAELSSGLSVLCGGTRDDKVRSAFSLYDQNGDGFISLTEMATYLRSVFRLLYRMRPEIQESMGVDADTLAQVTAEHAFAEADLDHDGRLSFNEFERWFTQGAPSVVEVAGGLMTLDEARRLTSLQSYDIGDLLSYFGASADAAGNISKRAFFECFSGLLDARVERTTENLENLGAVLENIFSLFDRDGNGKPRARHVCARSIARACHARAQSRALARAQTRAQSRARARARVRTTHSIPYRTCVVQLV